MIESQMNQLAPPDASGYFHQDPVRAGAQNLIEGCLGAVYGKEILIVAEDPRLGWYDAAAPASGEAALLEMGASVKKLMVGAPQNHALTAVQTAIDAADENGNRTNRIFGIANIAGPQGGERFNALRKIMDRTARKL